MKKIILLIFILSPSLINAQIVDGKNKFSYQLPMNFRDIVNTDKRRTYSSEDGVTFGYEIGQKILSEADIEKLIVLTELKLSETLPNFKLIHQEYPTIINDKTYGMLIYTIDQRGEAIYNSMLFTTVDLKLITFVFSCPLKVAKQKILILQDIMESIEYKSNY